MEKEMKEKIHEAIKTCSWCFQNDEGDVTIINTTPHPVRFAGGLNGTEIPSNEALVINASVEETVVSPFLVRSKFKGGPEGSEILAEIIAFCKEYGLIPGKNLMIVGSILAANAYPEIVGMVAVQGFERVPPAEKLMRSNKFNVGDVYPAEWNVDDVD